MRVPGVWDVVVIALALAFLVAWCLLNVWLTGVVVKQWREMWKDDDR